MFFGHADPDLAGERCVSERLACFVEQAHDTPRIAQQGLAGGRQGNTARTPPEKVAAGYFFEPFDLHADRRLGAVNRIRRPRQAARIGNGHESSEKVAVESCVHGCC